MIFYVASGLLCAFGGFLAGQALGDYRLEQHRQHVAAVLQRREKGERTDGS